MSSPANRHVFDSSATHEIKPSGQLKLEIEVLEERIAPAYLGGLRPAEPLGAAPCCATR